MGLRGIFFTMVFSLMLQSVAAMNFPVRTDFSLSAAGPVGVVAGDFNRDGREDLAVLSLVGPEAAPEVSGPRYSMGFGSIQILHPLPGGEFEKGQVLSVGERPHQILAKDLNQNGWLDLIVTNVMSDDVYIFQNRQGSYTLDQIIPHLAVPREVVVADFIADSMDRPDLMVVSQASNSVHFLRNASTANNLLFVPVNDSLVTVGSAPVSADLGIIDSSGKLTVAVANSLSRSVSFLQFDTALQSYQVLGTISGLSGPPNVIKMADLTGNGLSDVILGMDARAKLIIWDGQGGFETRALLSPNYSGGIYSISVADLNGSGLRDILFGYSFGSRVGIFTNLGGGQFEPSLELVSGYWNPTACLVVGGKSAISGSWVGSSSVEIATTNPCAKNDEPRLQVFHGHLPTVPKCGEIDLDGNGVVDMRDLELYLDKISSNTAPDLNGDGKVDEEDIYWLVSQLGKDCSAPAGKSHLSAIER